MENTVRVHTGLLEQCKTEGKLGIDYMIKAGYNPMAAIDVTLRIEDNYNDFFTDHPSTDKRVEAMRTYIAEKYPQFSTQKSYY